jgi:hypothetical protein
VTSLLPHVVEFGAELRERGVRLSVSDEMDAASALTFVDIGDVEEVRLALLTALKIRPGDQATFDELFDRFWMMRDRGRGREQGAARVLRAQAPRQIQMRLGSRPASENSPAGANSGDVPGYSPDAQLRKKSFDALDPQELAAMDRLMQRLSLKLATERSRRLTPTRGRGLVDLRRSLRAAVATRGEPLRLARRARALEEPRLILLCDTSGSMEAQTRFLLTFAIALRRAARRVEVFAFNTRLARITRAIAPNKVPLTLRRLGETVTDWSGGTRIGDCLTDFVRDYLGQMVNARTTVIIVSDGLDRGDPEVLARAMRSIRARARAVVWLNPLLGDARYEPTARGMAAALPYVDRLAPAHNLESLERLVTMLGR